MDWYIWYSTSALRQAQLQKTPRESDPQTAAAAPRATNRIPGKASAKPASLQIQKHPRREAARVREVEGVAFFWGKRALRPPRLGCGRLALLSLALMC